MLDYWNSIIRLKTIELYKLLLISLHTNNSANNSANSSAIITVL